MQLEFHTELSVSCTACVLGSRFLFIEKANFKEHSNLHTVLHNRWLTFSEHMHEASITVFVFVFLCVWPLGVLCIELALRGKKTPFAGYRNPLYLWEAIEKTPKLALEELPQDCPDRLYRLVEMCCEKEVSLRPTIDQLIEFLQCVCILFLAYSRITTILSVFSEKQRFLRLSKRNVQKIEGFPLSSVVARHRVYTRCKSICYPPNGC